MPPAAVQEKLRKTHTKLGEEIAAHEKAIQEDEEEKDEIEKDEMENEVDMAKDEEDEKEKTSQVETAAEGTPAYLLGDAEMPKGEKDMGGWTMRVYTKEQQERLHLTESGEPLDAPTAAQKADSAEVDFSQKEAEEAPEHQNKKLSKFESIKKQLKAAFVKMHPMVLLLAMLALFVMAFVCGLCRRRRSIDQLAGQYDRLTRPDTMSGTPMSPMGSDSQI